MIEIILYESFPLNEIPFLIVSAKTGVSYENQVGGHSCAHVSYEGFLVPFADIAPRFDDCELGCGDINPDNPGTQRFAANQIAKAILDYNDSGDWKLKFDFDYSRLSELKEDWWPVVITGTIGNTRFDKHPAIYTRMQNCD
ncbi:DUF6210 family protein [Alteromonas sp. RKMC-009]|uniref:DUF6210 family protein n=1 Tax=Alteromonas sp. RKMC-009 TaxID=2267264 RepID=UPI0010C49C5A|nr:DUF6210 family protein [Alteromonas sp. RKMC-009]AYA63865.2 hypothetical protein DS731_07530 [Alteromonas sp. RKMC-009]